MFRRSLLFITLCLVACNGLATSTLMPTPAPTPDGTLAQLTFEPSAARLNDIDACVRNWVNPQWTYRPYDLIGSFYEVHWCGGGLGGAACSTPAANDYRAQAVAQNFVSLGTFVFGNDFPNAHGLDVSGLYLPAHNGWGAQFSYVTDGRTLIGDGVWFDFWLFDQPNVDAQQRLHLGSDFGYTVFETQVQISDPLTQDEIVSAYVESPEAMRDLGLSKLAELQSKVESTIQTHQAQTCDLGTPPGNGLPPICVPRSLTAAEEAQALAEAQTHFAAQSKLLKDHYRAIYDSLGKAFPVRACLLKP